MPIKGFNIGKEASVVIVHPDFGPITFGLLTSFSAKPMNTRLTSTPITNGGKSIHRVVPTGWEGSFEIDRSDGVVDAIFQLLEDNYYGGKSETYVLIAEVITNPDGSIDEYRFKNCVLVPSEHGTFKADEKVTQRFDFIATNRERA